MKRIFYAILVLIFAFTLFALPCYAEEDPAIGDADISAEAPEHVEAETDSSAESENTPETPAQLAQDEEKAFLDQLMAIVTNGEIWAKIGASLLAVLALLVTLKSSLGKIGEAIAVLKDFIAGKATKEETETAINGAFEEVKNTYDAKLSELSVKNDELTAKYDKQTAILSLLALQLVKSPNARVQIMGLLAEAKNLGGNVAEVVESIEAEIEAADAAEPKPDTPALDAVIASVAEPDEPENTPAADPVAYIALG